MSWRRSAAIADVPYDALVLLAAQAIAQPNQMIAAVTARDLPSAKARRTLDGVPVSVEPTVGHRRTGHRFRRGRRHRVVARRGGWRHHQPHHRPPAARVTA